MKARPFSSTILQLSVSFSIVLCSVSLLLFTLNLMPNTKAAPMNLTEENVIPWDPDLRGAAGLGIVNDTAYFVVWANPNTLYKASIHSAKDWYKN